MITPKHFSVLLLLALFVGIVGCEKKSAEEEMGKAALLFNLDEEGNKEYYITGCDTIQIDSVRGEGYIYLTFTGCSHTFRDSIESTYYPDWYYNCYPMYDSQGVYLYDDCYWEYY